MLRVRVLSVRIPPGYVPSASPHPPPVPAVVDPELPTFPCALYSRMERRALSSEQTQSGWRHTPAEFHSTLSPQTRATVTNVCPWCSRTFSVVTVPPSSLVCPTCSILSPSLSALLECIRSHFRHVAGTDPAPEVAPLQKCIHERVGSWCSAFTSRSTPQYVGAEGRRGHRATVATCEGRCETVPEEQP